MRTPKISSKAVVVHHKNYDPPPLRIPFSCCLSGTNVSSPNTQQYTEKATIPNRPCVTCCVFNSSKFQDLPESPILLQCFICSATSHCYDFSYFVLFTYVFSLFLEVSHGAATLTHFSLTHIAATLLTHCTAVVLTHSIAILIALPQWCSIYSGQSCRLFFSQSLIDISSS